MFHPYTISSLTTEVTVPVIFAGWVLKVSLCWELYGERTYHIHFVIQELRELHNYSWMPDLLCMSIELCENTHNQNTAFRTTYSYYTLLHDGCPDQSQILIQCLQKVLLPTHEIECQEGDETTKHIGLSTIWELMSLQSKQMPKEQTLSHRQLWRQTSSTGSSKITKPVLRPRQVELPIEELWLRYSYKCMWLRKHCWLFTRTSIAHSIHCH